MKKLSEIPDIDKPREKLAKGGIKALTSLELIMLLLGSGVSGRDVRVLANDILNIIERDKVNLSLKNLETIQGIGKAKAGQILAAFELAQRYLLKDDHKIKCTEDVLRLVQDIRDKKQEHFITLTLTGASSLIEKRIVFKGTVDFSLVHPREVFADALTDRAAGIIFIHNHPAASAEPSDADIILTKNLCDASKILGISVIDHVIVTKKNFYSFQQEGKLNI
jgi:DNA repair protein RadC